MRYEIAIALLKLGHLISSWGCQLRGGHLRAYDYEYGCFCLMCGRGA